MIAVDSSILVYALNREAPRHGLALELVQGLVTASRPWGLPSPCIAEFLRVVTHRSFRPVVSAALAWRNVEALVASPSVQLLTPTSRHLPILHEVLQESGATGSLIFDAQIVTLCLEYGVREILTCDKDFRRFTGIKVTDPFA